MAISIRLFASAQQILGRESVSIPIDFPTTIAQIRNSLTQEFPQLNSLMQHSRFAVDLEYYSEDRKIENASEIALIPPVSGG